MGKKKSCQAKCLAVFPSCLGKTRATQKSCQAKKNMPRITHGKKSFMPGKGGGIKKILPGNFCSCHESYLAFSKYSVAILKTCHAKRGALCMAKKNHAMLHASISAWHKTISCHAQSHARCVANSVAKKSCLAWHFCDMCCFGFSNNKTTPKKTFNVLLKKKQQSTYKICTFS